MESLVLKVSTKWENNLTKTAKRIIKEQEEMIFIKGGSFLLRNPKLNNIKIKEQYSEMKLHGVFKNKKKIITYSTLESY